MAVTFQARRLQPVGHGLAFDDAQRGVRAGLAALGEFANAVANFVQHRPFLEAAPGGDQAEGVDVVAAGLVGGLLDRLRVHESVSGGIGLVKGGLGAKAAILGAGAGLGVDDGAEMDLVALEMFAQAVGAGHEIEDVGGGFQAEKPGGLGAGDFAAAQDPAGEFGNLLGNGCVNQAGTHG